MAPMEELFFHEGVSVGRWRSESEKETDAARSRTTEAVEVGP